MIKSEVSEIAVEISRVFSSNIPIQHYENGHLYKLLELPIIKPVVRNTPKPDNILTENKVTIAKTYVYRRKSKLKVKTIGEIRKDFENYVLKYLTQDLEKQKNIFSGLSEQREQSTEQSKKIFISNKPISRSNWKMLTNLNAEGHPHPKQYILWNGSNIIVNGSKGGQKKWLCNLDDYAYAIKSNKRNNKVSWKKTIFNSDNIKEDTFLPTLGIKEPLDQCSQVYSFDNADLAILPEIILERNTQYGVPLQPHLSRQGEIRLQKNCAHNHCMLEEKCSNFKGLEDNDVSCISKCTELFKTQKSNLVNTENKLYQMGLGIVDRSKNLSKKHMHEPFRELCVSLPRIDCGDIEALCMVHELYKCFCKGTFLTSTRKYANTTEEGIVSFSSKTFNSNENINTASSEGKTCLPEEWIGPRNQTNNVCNEDKVANLSLWLRDEFDYLKSEMDAGFESVLVKPYPKRLKLFPYLTLLARYKKNKIFILANKEPPYRICVVIDPSLEDLKKYVNIKFLTIPELQKCSDTVKHLIANNKLSNHFVLLKGFENYWEILGLVSRGAVPTTRPVNIKINKKPSKKAKDFTMPKDNIFGVNVKWFVMTIENDFAALRFSKSTIKRYISYNKIMSGITEARSLQHIVEVFLTMRRVYAVNKFGIYALPDIDKNCIVIGPYEIEQELSVEINHITDYSFPEKETRGTWMITRRNSNIFGEPQLFQNKHYVPKIQIEDQMRTKSKEKESNIKRATHANIMKPIHVKVNSSCYKLLTDIKTHTFHPLISSVCSLSNNVLPNPQINSIPQHSHKDVSEEDLITDSTEEADFTSMQIDVESSEKGEMSMDMTTDDILVIAEENWSSELATCESRTHVENVSAMSEVKIVCINVKNIGCLRGQRDQNNKISFQFPGFKHSDYYSEEDAFLKINQVMARKVLITKHLKLKWRVMDVAVDVDFLNEERLTPDYIITQHGLTLKTTVMKRIIRLKKQRSGNAP